MHIIPFIGDVRLEKLNTTIVYEGFIPNRIIDDVDICIIFGNALHRLQALEVVAMV